MDNLSKALAMLENKLEDGWEWPDAHSRACAVFEVDGDELSEEYDRKHSR